MNTQKHIGEELWKDVLAMKERGKLNISKTLFRFDIGRTRFYDIFKEQYPSMQHIALLSVMLGKDYKHLIEPSLWERYEHQLELTKQKVALRSNQSTHMSNKQSIKGQIDEESLNIIIQDRIKEYVQIINKLEDELKDKNNLITALQKSIDNNDEMNIITKKYIQSLEEKLQKHGKQD